MDTGTRGGFQSERIDSHQFYSPRELAYKDNANHTISLVCLLSQFCVT